MTNLKIITTTDTYREMTAEYEGIPILLRHYFKPAPAIHIRVDNNFARANGFNSLADLYRIDPNMRTVEWLDAEMLGQGIIAAVIGSAPIRPQTIN